MACPWFFPVEASAPGARKGLPTPLGDSWSGTCRASEPAWTPDPEISRRLCNFGYARQKCPRCPDSGPDAVRFSISGDRDGIIAVRWNVEKNHLPFAHGRLDYSRAAGDFPEPPGAALLAQQARAYVTSYLRRKGDAPGP